MTNADFLGGMYCALVTPLDENGRVVESVAEKMLAELLGTGLDGTYIGGSTGEGPLMAIDQRIRLVDCIATNMPADKKMIVHVGAAAAEDAIRLATHAAEVGAAAISSLPPAGEFSEVFAYYEMLADRSPLPLIVYYFPKVAPTAFPAPGDLAKVCDLPNVVGVKFTDFNLFLLEDLTQRGKVVFNGYDEVLVAGRLMGAQGGIGSTYNLMPHAMVALYRATQAGNWQQAREIQVHINRVIRTLMRYPWLPSIKAILRRQGFECGPTLNRERLRDAAQEQALFREFDEAMAGLQEYV
ncbi:MAG TPA: dihydrodipicolinate synthase family protein [Acidobacteriaceae bacterium]